MKATIDLPDELLRELKLRAIKEGRKMKDFVAETLRRGLAAPRKQPRLHPPRVTRDKKTGLPMIQCRPATEGDLTPDQIARLLLEQEVGWLRETA